jgi:hypothetical protein
MMQLHGHHTFVVITPRDLAPTDLLNLVHTVEFEENHLPVFEGLLVLTETPMRPNLYFIT